MKNILNLYSNYPKTNIDFQRFDFPSGCEPHIKIGKVKDGGITIFYRISNSNDLIVLLLIVDALKRVGIKRIKLFLPYIPFSRQDRVMIYGEPLSIKVMANLLNSQGFEKVTIYDPHSDVTSSLIDNVNVISNEKFVKAILEDKQNYLIVSPDAGSYKKIFKLCQYLEYKNEIILCSKHRDVENGNLSNITCPNENFYGKDLYIVDDICDGGGTFVMLAEELKKRNCGKINLIVSHGIFSGGIDLLENIDHIYTTDSFKIHPKHEKLTQVSLI